MNTLPHTALDHSNVAIRLGMCAAALAGVAGTASTAQAALVTFSTPISIPATFAGVYINLLTGATGSSGASVSGWDFNPYLSNGGTQLGFYWNPTPAASSGGVAGTASGPYLDLPTSTVVSAASTFTQSINATTGTPFLTATGSHILGFRFFNESAGIVNYGYLTMTNTAGNGFPATITGWTFEDSGAAITVGGVPEPTTGLLAALALGAVQLRRVRRKH